MFRAGTSPPRHRNGPQQAGCTHQCIRHCLCLQILLFAKVIHTRCTNSDNTGSFENDKKEKKKALESESPSLSPNFHLGS